MRQHIIRRQRRLVERTQHSGELHLDHQMLATASVDDEDDLTTNIKMKTDAGPTMFHQTKPTCFADVKAFDWDAKQPILRSAACNRSARLQPAPETVRLRSLTQATE